ncbi:MAG: DUF547 domain-containing protein, partial [Armatimonadetes bacterium]|nr:DUF547 domain-containing protein [Armatimonadota bacterium]
DPETGAPIYSHAPGSPELLAVGKAARELAAADPGNIQDPAESLAFWINVYNSLTIHALAVHQVRETVWEVPGFFDRVAYRIAGLRFALNDVEHGILRANRPELLSRRPRFPPDDPRFRFAVPSRARDPRVHFALNCGSRSCPPIGQYEGTLLDAQLDAAARSFLLAETEVNGYTVTTSSLLNWYGADFGELVSFLAGYLPEVAALPARRVRLRFRAYDWSVG